MAGTKGGGKKAAATNKMRYGVGFYVQIGRKGGQTSTNGGFANDDVVGADGLTGRQRAIIAGRKGGAASRRTKSGLMSKQGLESLSMRQMDADSEIEMLITEQAEMREDRVAAWI